MKNNLYTLTVDGWRYQVEVMDCTHLRWMVLANTAGTRFTPTPWCVPQHVGQLNYTWETALKVARIMSSNGALKHYFEPIRYIVATA